MRILIISEAHLIKTFVLATINKMKEETGARFDCFITTTIDDKSREALYGVFENVYVNEFPKGVVKNLPKLRVVQAIYGMRKMAKEIGNYDIAHIHFYYSYYSFLIPIIKRKARKIFLTFFGSDYYRAGNIAHISNRRSLRSIDRIFAISNDTLEDIIERYQLERTKTGILYFLISSFISFDSFLGNNTIDSAKAVWDFDKPVITCGYSAAAIMRHKMMIDSLDLVADKISGFKVVFPMTYGWRGGEMRTMVRARLKGSSLDSQVIEEFMPVEKLQALRLATDIFINVQLSDQMSATMLEHLAAGSVVITGRWFPYSDLIEMGAYLIFINTPEELPNAISDVVDNLEMHRMKSRVNRKIILDLMSWNRIKVNWYKYYNLA